VAAEAARELGLNNNTLHGFVKKRGSEIVIIADKYYDNMHKLRPYGSMKIHFNLLKSKHICPATTFIEGVID